MTKSYIYVSIWVPNSRRQSWKFQYNLSCLIVLSINEVFNLTSLEKGVEMWLAMKLVGIYMSLTTAQHQCHIREK